MYILVVNCGSSSLKYQLFDLLSTSGASGAVDQSAAFRALDTADESVLAKGLLERLGGEALLHHATASGTVDRAVKAANHTEAMKIVLDALVDPAGGVLERIDQIDGVGHRVVHGAEEVTGSARIDEALLAVIRRNAELAPLHNPPNLAGIEAAMAAIPGAVHVAVFDTAFLAGLPPRAYRYALPESWYARYRIRRYGFHGTSHRYVTLRAAELLGRRPDQVNLITVHLGNGCSMTAIAAGRAIDHSMGMTPLEGLVMGTRCGDIDPAIILHMLSRGLTPEEVDRALNKESGLLGLSGLSNDMRDLEAAAAKGHAGAALAREIFIYRVVKYIGAYHVILPALDAVVLTGGIGQNARGIRAGITCGLARLGARLDAGRNDRTVGGRGGPITADGSALPVWVVPTNEELMIARDTRDIIRGVAR